VPVSAIEPFLSFFLALIGCCWSVASRTDEGQEYHVEFLALKGVDCSNLDFWFSPKFLRQFSKNCCLGLVRIDDAAIDQELLQAVALRRIEGDDSNAQVWPELHKIRYLVGYTASFAISILASSGLGRLFTARIQVNVYPRAGFAFKPRYIQRKFFRWPR
jgi:hypothetical protein